MSSPEPSSWDGERCAGSALVIVLLALLLLSAVGSAMVVLTMADTLAASNQRDARAALYAAEWALEQAAGEVVRMPDLNVVLAGLARSARVDGPPSGVRRVPGGRLILLEELSNVANCGQPAACPPASLVAVTADRPWGANNPQWQLFSHGPTAGASPAFPAYTAVLVADDPAETDGDPTRDGAPGTDGAGTLLLRAFAWGPAGSRRIVQATVERRTAPTGAVAPGFVSWWPVQ